MAFSEQLVLGSQMKAAREVVYLSPDDAARHLGIGAEELVGWEEERSQPSLEALEAVAELYGRSLDYFLSATPEPVKAESLRSPERREFTELSLTTRKVLAQFDELCRKQLELERALGRRREVRVPLEPPETDPPGMAARARLRYGLGEGPVKRLRDLVEVEGVRIFELPAPPDELSGLSSWHAEYGPCILVNASDPAGRRSFTLAHEYCHLLMRDASGICQIAVGGETPGREERTADRFAVEFLMPKEPVRDDFSNRQMGERPVPAALGKLATAWGVSLEAMTRRLVEVGALSRAALSDVLAARDQWQPFFRKPRVPTWRRRLGEQYVSLAVEAYREGKVSLGKLAACLGVDIRDALKAAKGHGAR